MTAGRYQWAVWTPTVVVFVPLLNSWHSGLTLGGNVLNATIIVAAKLPELRCLYKWRESSSIGLLPS